MIRIRDINARAYRERVSPEGRASWDDLRKNRGTERFCLSSMPIWKKNGTRIVQDFREEYPCH